MTLRLTVASHVGLVRDHNEDAVGLCGWALQGDHPRNLTVDLPPGTMHRFAVCDGLGGHGSGEVASRFAAERLTVPTRDGLWSPERSGEASRKLFQDVSDQIVLDSRRLHISPGMGTTAVSVVVSPDQTEILVAHAGDSRAYVLDQGVFSQLTKDDRVRTGSSVLSQALGGGTLVNLDVHTTTVGLRDDSLLLLCSDGLVDMVDQETIERIVRRGAGATGAVPVAGEELELDGETSGGSAGRGAVEQGEVPTRTRTWTARDAIEQMADDLIAAALDGGGLDNITVAILAAGPGQHVSPRGVLSIEL